MRLRTSSGSWSDLRGFVSGSISEPATDVSAVAGDEKRDGDDSRRSFLNSVPVSTVDASESETLGLRTRFRGVGSGRAFLGGRPRPRFTGCTGVVVVAVVAVLDDVGFFVGEVVTFLGLSSADDSSSIDVTTLRFREAGVMASSFTSFFGVDGVTSFLTGALPLVLETRTKLLIFDKDCCWEVLPLEPRVALCCCFTAGIVTA